MGSELACFQTLIINNIIAFYNGKIETVLGLTPQAIATRILRCKIFQLTSIALNRLKIKWSNTHTRITIFKTFLRGTGAV